MKKENVTIEITDNWPTNSHITALVGHKYPANLFPCTDDERLYYAVLDSGETIPHGCFDVISKRVKVKEAIFTKEFSQGYVAALTAILFSHGISTAVKEAWKANFGSAQTLASLKEIGIDKYDIGILKPFLKELNKG